MKTNHPRKFDGLKTLLAMLILLLIPLTSFADEVKVTEDTQGVEAPVSQEKPVCLDCKDPELVKDGLFGSVTMGGAGSTQNVKSFKFGEYSGVFGDNGYAVGGADLNYSQKSYFVNVFAEDLGLNNRNMQMEAGSYGDYKVSVGYSELPHYISNVSQSPYEGIGGTSLQLPGNFVKANTTTAMRMTSLNDSDLTMKRSAESFGIAKSFGEDLDFKASFKNEDKNGVYSLGGTFGTTGGNTRAIVLPEVINQSAKDFTATLAHNTEKYQAQLDYSLSIFNNNVKSMTFENPYSGTAMAASGLISLPQDNQYWKVGASGGVDLPLASRLSAVAEYGAMTQNDTLLPFALGTSTGLLPRATADAEIDIVHLLLNASSNPLPGLNLTAKYRHYETINKTPQTLFLYAKNDTLTQATMTSDFALYSQPYEYKQNLMTLDGVYHLFKGTNLKMGYAYELMDRTGREVGQTNEYTFKTGIKSNYFSSFSVGFDASIAKRNETDAYNSSRVFDQRHTQEYINAQLAAGVPRSSLFDENILLRRYDVADRDRVKYGANLTFFPITDATVGVYYNYKNDQFGKSILGLNSSETHSITADVNYTPSETTSYFAYYTYERVYTQQTSLSFNSAATALDRTRNWTANHDDDVNTIGLGVNRALMRKKLNLGFDYALSDSTTAITFLNGTSAVVANPVNPPNLNTLRHTFRLNSMYRYTKNLDLGARYIFEKYENSDFLLQYFTPGLPTMTNVLTLSGLTPNYNAQFAMLYATYHFDTPK